MKPPKNFYSNLDRRKQGLPEVPEASAADAGKVIKVGSDGSYELGADAGLPAENIPTNLGMLITRNSSWILTTALNNRLMSFANNVPNYIKSFGIYIDSTGIKFNSINSSLSAVMSYCDDTVLMPATVVKNNICYQGFYVSKTSVDITFFTINTVDRRPYLVTYDGTNIDITSVGSTVYYEITASGSSVSLPSGVTFADVYAELMAGVDVKFTSGARVYTVTSFESTNIRAHWMSDLDLTNMDVSVINLESDGTGTVKTVTFSGT